MKRIVGYVGLALLIIIIGMFFIESYAASVPNLIAKYNEEDITVMRGSYCWRSIIKGKCVDTIGPEELIEGIRPTKVKSNEHIKIDFSKKPQEVRVETLLNNEQLMHDNKGILELPKDLGVHIIMVYARWNSGSVSYVFTIEVE